MAEETVNTEITVPPDEPVVDTSLMQVLINISASLKRIEEHLVPKEKEAKSSDDDPRDTVATLDHSDPEPETLYYNVTLEDEQRIVNRLMPQLSPHVQVHDDARVLEVFPDPVSDNSWKYYKPIWGGSDGMRYTTMGRGKHNLLPLWEISQQINTLFNTRNIWYIPYSKIPGFEVGLLGVLRAPFNTNEKRELYGILKNLWKLPSDYRLDFDFQDHLLRKENRTVEQPNELYLKRARKIWEDLDRLTSAGGSFNIYDQTGYSQTRLDHNPVVYNLTSNSSTEDAEEWLIDFPPTAMNLDWKGSHSGKHPVANPRHPGWRRWIFIEGFAETYSDRFWRLPGGRLGKRFSANAELVFNLHISCATNAMEAITGETDASRGHPPMIFHICAKGIYSKESLTGESVHDNWKSRKMMGSQSLVLSSMSYTMQMFPARAGVEYWTLLFLLPHRMKRDTLSEHAWMKGPSGKCLMMAMLLAISWSFELASRSWVTVADHFEGLLDPIDPDKLPTDADYSQSHTCFWIISNIEEFEPLILDAIEQWLSFKTKHKLDDEMQEFPLEQLELPDKNETGDLSESLENRRKEMIGKIREVETHTKKFEDSLRRLRALRERAKTTRDGLFSLTSVVEARQSRLLGENVKLLTYVTIFYLPLTFSTSMWVINDMFGTGTTGFAIITTVLGLLTYGVVFGLLHSISNNKLVTALKRGDHALKDAFSVRTKINGAAAKTTVEASKV